MTDKYRVYRPFLDLLGLSEGTDKGRGYNETLAYGAYSGGNVDLVHMTLDQVDALQTRMLGHPKNKLNSSAVGRYQIVRTTMRAIRASLDLVGTSRFDEYMQDRMACYLLGVRGIDKWLSGRMKETTLLDNLAAEWASLPMSNGKGRYGGQRAAVTPAHVRTVLAEVRKLHMNTAPFREVVPPAVEKEVEKKTGWFRNLFGAGGVGAIALAWLKDADWQWLLAIAGIGAAGTVVIVVGGVHLVRRIKEIKAEVEA